MDYKRNARYFEPAPKNGWCYFWLVLGALLSLSMVSDDKGMALFIILFFGIPSGFVLLKRNRKEAKRFNGKEYPTDTEIDEQVVAVMNEVEERALNRHGITKEETLGVPSLLGGGYITSQYKNALNDMASMKQQWDSWTNTSMRAIDNFVIETVGKDRVTRASSCEFGVLTPTTKEILYYKVVFSLVTPTLKETTKEFFYKDITSISVENSSFGRHFFKIVLGNGDAKYFPLLGKEEEINRTVNEIKKELRNIRS